MSFQNFQKRWGGGGGVGWGGGGASDFSSHKYGGFGKKGEVAFLKKEVSLLFILTLSSVIFLWVFGVCMCVRFFYNISISIICVSKDKLSLIESNQQIYDFYKWIFEKKRHRGKSIFDIKELFL